MKNVFFGLALMMSFSVFAESVVEDSARFPQCGGKVELRSHIGSQGEERFALQFIGVKKCSNVRLSTGEDYKLTDKHGKFEGSKNISISDDAAKAARRSRGLSITIESNTGATSEEVVVLVRRQAPIPAPTPAPAPAPAQEEYEPSEWN